MRTNWRLQNGKESSIRKMTVTIVAIGILLLGTTVWPPALAAQPMVSGRKNQQILTKKQLKFLLKNARTASDHHKLASYYRQNARQLTKQSIEHNEEADGYASGTLLEPKTSIPGGLLRHCREWASRYAEAARRAEAAAQLHDRIAQEMSKR